MTGKGKKKKVDFTVRPKPTREDLPPTSDQWIEEGKAADAGPEKPDDIRPEKPVDVHPEKPADDGPKKEKEKRLTLNLPVKMHTAFKGLCVFEGITIQDKVQRLIERELVQEQRSTEDKPSSL